MGWDREMEALAEEIAAACRAAIGSDTIGVRDDCETMWDADYDPYVGPNVVIGRFNWYAVVETRRERLFGVRWLPQVRRRRKLVELDLEEMFLVPSHTKTIACRVRDARATAVAQPIVERFALHHGLKCRFFPPDG